MARLDTSDMHKTWDELFDALIEDRAEIARRVREALQRELPPYRAIAEGELSADVLLEVERVLRSARAGQAAVSARELAELAAVGEVRARQGVPVDDMLRAWRVGVQVVTAYAREVASRLGIGDGQVLEFVQSTMAWSDVAMVTTAAAHRRTELDLALAEQERRAVFVRGVLFGAMAPTNLRMQAESYSLDLTRDYVAVHARAAADASIADLERALGLREATQHRRGLSTLVDGDLVGFLRERPDAAVPGVVGVGPPRPLQRLAESYRLATRALDTAVAFALKGVHDVPSLGLRAAVASDADVGEALRARYLDRLGSGGSSGEMYATLRTFLACGMHVERTAEQLFVHPNTVRYRLSRFEELTGASLRESEVAFEVWWALERAALRL